MLAAQKMLAAQVLEDAVASDLEVGPFADLAVLHGDWEMACGAAFEEEVEVFDTAYYMRTGVALDEDGHVEAVCVAEEERLSPEGENFVGPEPEGWRLAQLMWERLEV